MTLKDLSITLSDMYFNAPPKDRVTMIHLFGTGRSDRRAEGKGLYRVRDPELLHFLRQLFFCLSPLQS